MKGVTNKLADGTIIDQFSYTYDLSNQLIRSVTKDAVINNTYNAAGYRVAKESYVGGKTLSQERHGD